MQQTGTITKIPLLHKHGNMNELQEEEMLCRLQLMWLDTVTDIHFYTMLILKLQFHYKTLLKLYFYVTDCSYVSFL